MTSYRQPRGAKVARPGAPNDANMVLTPIGALIVMIVVAGLGAAFDLATGIELGRVFALSLIAGTALAAILVRRAGLWVVIATPSLLFMAMSALGAYVKTDYNLDNIANDNVISWLILGFPEMATATAVAALITIIRSLRQRTQ